MDYRERDYYLVTIDYFSYDMRMEMFKLAAPSLKIHAPYRHIRTNGRDQDWVDHRYWQMMVSCRHEDSDTLEYELRKATRRDERRSQYIKLDKEICGQ